MAYDFDYASSNLTFDAGVNTETVNFNADFSIKDTVVITAYDVAVENGYVGTVTEWLASLHGRDGATDYNQLDNKPTIEGVEILGNKSFADYNLKSITNIELENMLRED